MKIIVLWEDQLDVDVRNFGPGTLLAACVADRLQCQMTQVAPLLKSIPRKGNGGIRKTLRSDFVQLEKSGPVFVVLDRDISSKSVCQPVAVAIPVLHLCCTLCEKEASKTLCLLMRQFFAPRNSLDQFGLQERPFYP